MLLFYFKFNLTTNKIEIQTKYERLKLTSVLVKEPWAIALLTVNSRLLRNKDKQPTLLIVPGRFIQTTRVAITKSSECKAIEFLQTSLHTVTSTSLKKMTRCERSSTATWQATKYLVFCRFNELDVFMNYSSNPYPKATRSLSAVVVLIMLLSSQSMNISSCEYHIQSNDRRCSQRAIGSNFDLALYVSVKPPHCLRRKKKDVTRVFILSKPC
jgi:hypothetical protein